MLRPASEAVGLVFGSGVQVREGVLFGAHVTTGDRVETQSQVEDDVFVGRRASTTNDHTMSRHGPHCALPRAAIRRAARIGGSAVLVRGVEVRDEAFVGADPVVTKDVPARGFMVGVPARQIRDVSDEELLERWR